MAAKTTQTRVIKIVTKDVSSTATAKISKQFGKLNKNIVKTGKSMVVMKGYMSRLKSAFVGLAAVMGAREIIRSADAFQLTKDRIRSLWGEGVNANEVFQKIAMVARDTNSSVETLSDGFARMSISTKDMGLSVDETINFVKSLQQTLRLSGATVAEANSVFLQMSQAFGLGRLQGQELRAVMLGNAEGAKILADIFETTKGRLRDFGEKGLLDTSKIAKGFAKRLDDLNKRAGKLKATFGQSLLLVLDAFRLEMDKINTALGGSQSFNKIIKTVIKNMDLLLAVTTALVTGGVLYKLAGGLAAVGTALAGKSLIKLALILGPKGAALAAVATLAGMATFLAMQEKPATNTIEKLLKLNDMTTELEKIQKRNITNQKKLNAARKTGRDYNSSYITHISTILMMDKIRVVTLNRRIKKQKELIKLGTKAKAISNIKVAREEFSKFNAVFRNNRDMKEYVELLRAYEISNVNKKLEKDKISFIDYNNKIEKINKSYDDMLSKMEDIKNKDNVFHGIQKGAEDTIKSIGTLAKQISDITTRAFGHLEDALFDFVKKGQFEFKKFAQSIMDDITRVVIRMSIIRPLAQGLTGALSGGAPAQGGTTTANFEAANGGAFKSGNVIPFATGGIINRPSTFGMSNNRTGLMGESGPEAILPLARGPNGRLGVDGSMGGTIVNVINNNSDVETETKKSSGPNGTEQIDIYIRNKVGEAISEGSFDKTFNQIYGLNRRGI